MMQRAVTYDQRSIARILTGESMPMQRRCPLCCSSARPIEGAHTVPRSVQSEPEAPIIPLCKACHEAHDAYQWKPLPIEGGWRAFIAADDFARWLNSTSPRAVKEGFTLDLLFEDGFGNYPDVFPDPLESYGDALHEIAERIIAAEAHGAEAWRLKAEAFVEAEATFLAAFASERNGDKQAREAFAEWTADLGIAKSEASGMRAVVTYVHEQDARTLPRTMQEALARAVRLEVADYSDLLADAETLSVSDFKREHLPRPEQTEPEPEVRCPTCGSYVRALNGDTNG